MRHQVFGSSADRLELRNAVSRPVALLLEPEEVGRTSNQRWTNVSWIEGYGFDTASRMASDAIFASSLESSASPPHAPIRELDPLDELSCLVSEDT
jgi:hypothetical protein